MNEPLKLIHPTDEATYRRIYAAAIEGYTGGTTKGDQVSGGMSAFDECVAIILPLLQKQIATLSQRPADPAWISVSERLPEEHQDVLLMRRGANQCECGWLDHRGYYWMKEGGATIDSDRVTHWQPFPTPPLASPVPKEK